ncbi:TIM-barrel domain-containing protein [Ornithinimicrobium cerasi]|uniref:Glycosyl hydrolases family 31 n=1 Tax=Ornithinimicrobium cerasi TaxID=2248773 RepID=A0A285VSB5_9MICO|nr:TIM-barrel domain-containing protein [Ornithinimicrobium cerasi]SOC56945.1 Glycosyl hydrolases family 31 [Ornithinimicrobium cerasi]
MRIVHESDHARLSVLSPQLVRFEWSPGGRRFTDTPTQVVLDRDLGGDVEADVAPWRDGVHVRTTGVDLYYDGAEPTPSGLFLQVRGGVTSYHSTWRYGVPPRPGRVLDGTARTLDEVDGRCDLEPGVVSRDGFAVLDDSTSLARTGPGVTQVAQREPGAVDLYVFAHGLDYRAALRDFHALTGPVPRVPRFVLGNWWSRYHPYSEEDYLRLLDRFAADRVPFAVAVLDMDWHVTDVDPSHGSGWTGYTWDPALFPDPGRFLAELHRRGLRVTLNDHPADGVRAFEDAYPAVAEAVGVDPASGAAVAFDATSETFLSAFFEHVAHPMERTGVDFWWIDWQQGEHSAVPGLDPLWVLNERHFAELGSTGRRPLVFSRYAGPGSHRTPVGFSGDTVISWASLRFQPEFTASAANIGYGWWSHDIGGHWGGRKDVELAVRWVQLGVWSPVNRLHATASPFQGKEPWRFGPEAAALMGDALRLRHRLVPYLATMAERASVEGIPLAEPVYHRFPGRAEAYAHRATYFFGADLLCAPVVEPRDPRVGLARVDLWLPPGTWFDLETGRRYEAGAEGRPLTAWRDLAHTVVLARAGTVLPMVTEEEVADGVELPTHLELRVFADADGEHVLVEDDDGPAATRRLARTPLRLDWAARSLTVGPAEGDLGVLPAVRTWTVRVVGAEGEPVVVRDVPVGEQVTVSLEGPPSAPPVLEECFALLDAAEVEHGTKDEVWGLLTRGVDGPRGALVSELLAARLDEALLGALTEVLTAS